MICPPHAIRHLVSRETQARLEQFERLVRKWSSTINLVSKSQLGALWERHIWDSAQIWPHLPAQGLHVALGSGGGFPGIVLAIIARSEAPKMRFQLIESDARKSVFLKTAVRELDLACDVTRSRYEDIPALYCDSLTARALASLSELLEAAERHMKPSGVAIFPKGAQWQAEVLAAEAIWAFHLTAMPSMTSGVASLLKIKDITRV